MKTGVETFEQAVSYEAKQFETVDGSCERWAEEEMRLLLGWELTQAMLDGRRYTSRVKLHPWAHNVQSQSRVLRADVTLLLEDYYEAKVGDAVIDRWTTPPDEQDRSRRTVALTVAGGYVEVAVFMREMFYWRRTA